MMAMFMHTYKESLDGIHLVVEWNLMHEILLVFAQFLWSMKSIFSGSYKKLS